MPSASWLLQSNLPSDSLGRKYISPDDLDQILDQFPNWRNHVNAGGKNLSNVGTLTAASLSIGTFTVAALVLSGPLSGATTGSFSGAISALSAALSGPLSATTGTFSSSLAAASLALTGPLSGATTGAFSQALAALNLTLSGPLYGATTGSFSGAVSSVNVYLNGAAGSERVLAMYSGANARWSVMANSLAESGGNAGSDFVINRFNDAGVFINSVLQISRATGRTILSANAESLALQLKNSSAASTAMFLGCNAGGDFILSNASGVEKLKVAYADGQISQAAWQNCPLSSGFSHISGNELRYRLNRDNTVIVAGQITGSFSNGGQVFTVPSSSRNQLITASIDGGHSIFLVAVGGAVVFYGSGPGGYSIPNGTYTVRVGHTYPLD